MWKARTRDPKEHLRFTQPSVRFVPVLKHLQHLGHLLPAIRSLIFDYVELLALSSTVNLYDFVS